MAKCNATPPTDSASQEPNSKLLKTSKYCLIAIATISYLFLRRQVFGAPLLAEKHIFSGTLLVFIAKYCLPTAFVTLLVVEVVNSVRERGWFALFRPIRDPHEFTKGRPRIWMWVVLSFVVIEILFLFLSLID